MLKPIQALCLQGMYTPYAALYVVRVQLSSVLLGALSVRHSESAALACCDKYCSETKLKFA